MLHIFNPETDYALAHNKKQYTPPAKIVALRSALAMLPAVFAAEGDAILRLDPKAGPSPYDGIVAARRLSVIGPDDIAAAGFAGVRPWGWNPALRALLSARGCDAELLPSENDMERLRVLAHRRTTIPFSLDVRSGLSEYCHCLVPEQPREIHTLDELQMWLDSYPDSYLKAPWSSSGRGVLHTAASSRKNVMAWAAGIIGSQQSVMAEKGECRILDFASEWECIGGRAVWKGWSVFRADAYGRYLYNLAWSRDALERMIAGKTAVPPQRIVEAQRAALDELVAPYYSGPVGIDMIATSGGQLNPCIEINLRHTMGMAAAAVRTIAGADVDFNPRDPQLPLSSAGKQMAE